MIMKKLLLALLIASALSKQHHSKKHFVEADTSEQVIKSNPADTKPWLDDFQLTTPIKFGSRTIQAVIDTTSYKSWVLGIDQRTEKCDGCPVGTELFKCEDENCKLLKDKSNDIIKFDQMVQTYGGRVKIAGDFGIEKKVEVAGKAINNVQIGLVNDLHDPDGFHDEDDTLIKKNQGVFGLAYGSGYQQFDQNYASQVGEKVYQPILDNRQNIIKQLSLQDSKVVQQPIFSYKFEEGLNQLNIGESQPFFGDGAFTNFENVGTKLWSLQLDHFRFGKTALIGEHEDEISHLSATGPAPPTTSPVSSTSSSTSTSSPTTTSTTHPTSSTSTTTTSSSPTSTTTSTSPTGTQTTRTTTSSTTTTYTSSPSSTSSTSTTTNPTTTSTASPSSGSSTSTTTSPPTTSTTSPSSGSSTSTTTTSTASSSSTTPSSPRTTSSTTTSPSTTSSTSPASTSSTGSSSTTTTTSSTSSTSSSTTRQSESEEGDIVEKAVREVPIPSNHDATFDTTTRFIWVDKTIQTQLVKEIKNSLNKNCDVKGVIQCPCSDKSDVKKFPELSFLFNGQTHKSVINTEDYVEFYGEHCYVLVREFQNEQIARDLATQNRDLTAMQRNFRTKDRDAIVLPNTFLKQNFVQFDQSKNQIQIAKSRQVAPGPLHIDDTSKLLYVILGSLLFLGALIALISILKPVQYDPDQYQQVQLAAHQTGGYPQGGGYPAYNQTTIQQGGIQGGVQQGGGAQQFGQSQYGQTQFNQTTSVNQAGGYAGTYQQQNPLVVQQVTTTTQQNAQGKGSIVGNQVGGNIQQLLQQQKPPNVPTYQGATQSQFIQNQQSPPKYAGNQVVQSQFGQGNTGVLQQSPQAPTGFPKQYR